MFQQLKIPAPDDFPMLTTSPGEAGNKYTANKFGVLEANLEALRCNIIIIK